MEDEYTLEKLEELHTRQLMSILNSVRAYRQNSETLLNSYILRIEELTNTLDDYENKLEQRKAELVEYDAYMAKLKAVLSTREHIPNKQEAKAIRQQRAKQKR